MRQLRLVLSIAAVLFLGMASAGADGKPYIVVASTTSTQNSGLFGHLLPRFRSKTGIAVRIVAVGTGQALRLARNGDADVLLVHHRASEERFVAAGFGVRRFEVMANDFVIVGPASDPARVGASTHAAEAFQSIAEAKALFLSRGDDSGTHKRELELWRAAGIDARRASGTWYREAGAGMGATLNSAAAMAAYTLTDRGTWLAFGNKAGLAVLVEGDARLANPYGVILVNPKRHPHVKAALGQAFIDWLIGPPGQAAIAAFRIGGRRAFMPSGGG
ncbi:MAG: substrate-binding domain-containing protein [Rhodospirillales bacterium]|jgi:tungstate transport system substrate-binding protein|nr:substrate-binding domain-containing protein [Rhodospirillales bacterium]MDP6882582.1 substrate-binding domain-containing protein [Rhodospirillales bacterium]